MYWSSTCSRNNLRVVYNLSQSPATFDFVHFLVRAEQARILEGDKDLHVSIVWGDRQVTERDRAFSPERKAWRQWNLLPQICRLLPSVSGFSFDKEGVQTLPYSPPLPVIGKHFQPSEAAKSVVAQFCKTDKPIVTITLRDSDFQKKRNSNVKEWQKICDWLKEQRYCPVILPDTECVMGGKESGITGHLEYIPGSMNVDLRLALYDRAILNLFTSNGPLGLCLWAGLPTLACKMIIPEVPTCTLEAITKVGQGPDSPLGEYQKIVDCDDTFENLKPHLEEFLPECKKRERPLPKIHSFSVLDESARIANMHYALAKSKKKLELIKPHDRTMVLACYGPSLKKTWWELFEDQKKGDLFTVSGAHNFVMSKGINPYAHVMSDPRPNNVSFVQNPSGFTKYFIASCCDKSVFDILEKYDTILWHAWNSHEFEDAVKETDPNGMLVLGGSNVGLRTLALGTALGYRKFIVHGMDGSFEETDGTVNQHAGEHSGKVQPVIKVKAGDKWFNTSPAMLVGGEDLMKMIGVMKGCEFWFKGDGLIQYTLKLFNESQKKAA